MEVKMNEERKIPFVGCVRVGNFKIWKAKQRKKGNIDVDIIRISDLEGNWSVKIPQTYLAYPMIEQCFKEGRMVMMEQVHHIKPLAEGGTHERSNLISLCASCHARIHAERGDRWHNKKTE